MINSIDHEGFNAIALCFKCESFKGDPLNCEPEKCGDVRFFPKDELPGNLVDNVRQSLKLINIGFNYSEYGI